MHESEAWKKAWSAWVMAKKTNSFLFTGHPILHRLLLHNPEDGFVNVFILGFKILYQHDNYNLFC